MTTEITNRKLWYLIDGSEGLLWLPYGGELDGKQIVVEGCYWDLTSDRTSDLVDKYVGPLYSGTIETIEITSGYGVRASEDEPWSVLPERRDAIDHAARLEDDELSRDIELASNLRKGE